jgi:hypothetical protein
VGPHPSARADPCDTLRAARQRRTRRTQAVAFGETRDTRDSGAFSPGKEERRREGIFLSSPDRFAVRFVRHACCSCLDVWVSGNHKPCLPRWRKASPTRKPWSE